MKKYICLLFLIFILNINLFSQNDIKSLERKLSNSSVTENEKVDVLNELAEKYKSISAEKIVEYGKRALELSKKIDYKKGEAKSLSNIGSGYTYLSNYDKALEYYLKYLRINEEMGDKNSIALSFNYIGNVHCKMSNYDRALGYFLKSLKINEEMGNKQGISVSVNYIGTVYWYLNDYDKALEYYLKSLEINEEIGDKKSIVYSLNNIGIIYHKLKNYNKALEYYLRSLKLYEEIGNKNGVASLLNNISVIYKDSVKYDKALEYNLKSLKIFEEIGNKNGIAISLKNTGEIYLKLKKYKKALLYLEQGLKLAKEIGTKDLIKDCYETFAELYSVKANYQKSLEYYKLYSKAKDSIFTKESSEKVAEMQTKYETEKKERKIEVLQKDNDIKKLEIIHQINFRNYLIVISGLILILILVIYSRYRTKKKANEILFEKNSQILKQKNQLSQTLNQLRETQKTLVDISHRTGMAEIASSILHNVGNVLNSVKVSSQILKEKIEGSRINNLQKSLDLIKQHKTDLTDYITSDDKGKMLPDYLIKVGRALKDEQNACINELSNLYNGINHIEGIISVQQNYAGVSGIKERISLVQIMNDIIKMYQDSFNKYKIKVNKNYKEVTPILTEKAKLMQVLVNILKNAKESLEIKKDENRVITINIFEDKGKECQIIEIIDNGIGIEKENLDKIFSYGFTTKKNSKGFGLHTSALAMEDIKGEMLAYSDGKDKGAKFSVLVTEI